MTMQVNGEAEKGDAAVEDVVVCSNEQSTIVQITNENITGNVGVLEMVSPTSEKWYTK